LLGVVELVLLARRFPADREGAEAGAVVPGRIAQENRPLRGVGVGQLERDARRIASDAGGEAGDQFGVGPRPEAAEAARRLGFDAPDDLGLGAEAVVASLMVEALANASPQPGERRAADLVPGEPKVLQPVQAWGRQQRPGPRPRHATPA